MTTWQPPVQLTYASVGAPDELGPTSTSIASWEDGIDGVEMCPGRRTTARHDPLAAS
jgi:hypothetical protein